MSVHQELHLEVVCSDLWFWMKWRCNSAGSKASSRGIWKTNSTQSSGNGHSRGSGLGSMWKSGGSLVWMRYWGKELPKRCLGWGSIFWWLMPGVRSWWLCSAQPQGCLHAQLQVESSTVNWSTMDSEASFRLSQYIQGKLRCDQTVHPAPLTVQSIENRIHRSLQSVFVLMLHTKSGAVWSS